MLRFLGSDSIDSVITDPPYGLEFMGKVWDKDVPVTAVWEGCLRVAKPGAFLLAFGGTRTYHRLACAIEDAGWEIRDCVMYVYGSGFPKSHNIGKAIDKAAGAEREVVGKADPRGAYDEADRSSTGHSNEYGSITSKGSVDVTAPATDAAKQWEGWGTALKPAYEPIIVAMKPLDGTFAQNALEHGVAGLNIDEARINPGETVPGGGNTKANHGGRFGGAGVYQGERPKVEPHNKGRWPANLVHNGSEEVLNTFPNGAKSAARFFYCAKVSKAERTHKGQVENKHPTVKPIALMEYLCRLTSTPTGGLVLDPFCGSGSTGIAALRTGRKFIGIEKDPESYQLARKRLEIDVQETREAEEAAGSP